MTNEKREDEWTVPVWTVEVEGKSHTVEFSGKGLRKHLYIDGIEDPIRSRVPLLTLVDRTIWLGTKPVQIVIVGRKADLAVDGVYLTSGKPYREVNRIPAFVWVFFFLCAFLGLVLADLAGLAAGLVGGYFCIRVAIMPDWTVKKQVWCCVGIFALCMAFHVGMHFVIDQWMGDEAYLIEMQMLQNMSQYAGSEMMPG